MGHRESSTSRERLHSLAARGKKSCSVGVGRAGNNHRGWPLLGSEYAKRYLLAEIVGKYHAKRES